MVSAFIRGAGGPGSTSGRGHCVVFLGKTLTVPLSTLMSINGYWQIVEKPNKLWKNDLQ